jgi:hypothetical protein
MSSAPLRWLVPAPHRAPLSIRGPRPDLQEDESLLQIKLSVGAWWDLLLVVQGMHPGGKGGDKSPSPQSQMSPQEMWQ